MTISFTAILIQGYLHRGERCASIRNFIQNIPHLERPVIHDSANITYSYSLAVEELAGIEVPRRGQFIRANIRIRSSSLYFVLACNIRNLSRTFNNVYNYWR